ncbi:methionine adenosyltransferase [Candidatus Hecatella orcuttiae]|jgi:S-adenosylmethionine synthetase|uniref:methionine adenosyltransferase n=1 Tax=Candidatus Hecatella orcuttiae TaxID=1935119 RepID=UPI002867F39E|nr:methionine adenosyltransferase [Candidatus Hecatella orcuttiae]
MARVLIESIGRKPTVDYGIEIVERKGKGHPDYIADAVAENLSRELCKCYLEKFGAVLHHNLDKGLVVGGKSNPRFGGGEVLEPIHIIVAGRAITKSGGEVVPLGELVENSVKALIKRNFRFLDPDKHVKVYHKIREGSMDLVKIFQAGKTVPLSNDTSFGVSFAPLTPTEKLVLEAEKYLNSEGFKKELPEVGEDIKVMGLRNRNKVKLTISAAMISPLIPNKEHYISVKGEVCKKVKELAATLTDMDVDVKVNVGDRPRVGCFYLTVTGTSAEMGDDGNTGRGNRVNGLITPCRQMSLEATAGKNPVSHVGKIYNLLARILANKIYEEVKGIREVYVKILSQIGKPINKPLMTNVQTVMEKGRTLQSIKDDVKSIVDEEVAGVTRLTEDILRGVELF